ncbi:MAG: hypothetical protein KDI63_14775 [Gammaproteobacteria bacterium]|nr:hypothetical protein [Gammaproteobacteria bacterium]
MKAKTLLVVSDDKIVNLLFSNFVSDDNIILVKDKSSSLKRIIKLIRKGSLPILAVLKMAIAEFMRPNSKPQLQFLVIKSSSELLSLYDKYLPERIILFRAGLIVKRDQFPQELELLNVHCASLPAYGGLASIYRALNNGDYNQKATLHRVTNVIDGGEVLNELPYQMEPSNSYRRNEDIAYETGYELLLSIL